MVDCIHADGAAALADAQGHPEGPSRPCPARATAARIARHRGVAAAPRALTGSLRGRAVPRAR